jgi:broad specificity phosphatase PhoE
MGEGDIYEVWLVRHGETEWSRSGKHTSTTELPLLPEGEDVARGLRDRLSDTDFAMVLTSPRERARTTAEWAYGEYEGITTPEIRKTVPGWTVWSHPSPGGETAEQVEERLDRVVTRLRGANGPALVFGHGHALRALTARWLGLPATDGRLFRLDTATVSVLGHERDSPVILRWNS